MSEDKELPTAADMMAASLGWQQPEPSQPEIQHPEPLQDDAYYKRRVWADLAAPILIVGVVFSVLAVPVNLVLLYTGLIGSFSFDKIVDDWRSLSQNEVVIYTAAMLIPPLTTVSALLALRLIRGLATGILVVDILLAIPAVGAIIVQAPFVLRTLS